MRKLIRPLAGSFLKGKLDLVRSLGQKKFEKFFLREDKKVFFLGNNFSNTAGSGPIVLNHYILLIFQQVQYQL